MASDPDALRRRRAGNAVTSWSQTVRTLRQHGGVARLLDRAVLGCRRELATVLATEDLTIELAGGEVRCAGQTVLTYGRADVPFGLLAEAGVGTVILGRGTAEPELERLLRTCAAAPGNHDASYDLARALRAADLPGLSLRAPSRSRRVGSTAPGVDWWLLPAPHPNAELTRSIEREHAANLPARAMRLLLADLETGTPDRPTGPLLEALLDTMLARDDAAGAAELLERVAHSSAVSDATTVRLRRRALAAYDGDWLPQQLEQEHRLHGLVSLGMQLGEDAFDRLATAAAACGVELPPWVRSLEPPRG